MSTLPNIHLYFQVSKLADVQVSLVQTVFLRFKLLEFRGPGFSTLRFKDFQICKFLDFCISLFSRFPGFQISRSGQVNF